MKALVACNLLLVLACVVISEATSCPRYKRSAQSTRSYVRQKRTASCTPSDKYRSVDGTCNNLKYPSRGAAGAEYVRWLDPEYNDGIGTPRIKSVSDQGGELPHPRAITNKVHFELSFISQTHTLATMSWGQFLDHDMMATPVITDNGEDIDCCSTTVDAFNDADSSCIPLRFPDDDVFFDDGKCINLTRSEKVDDTGTSSVPRQQYNSVSAYIDGSQIYGITEEETSNLREGSGGRLKVKNTNMLPEDTNAEQCFIDDTDTTTYCLLAGDDRVNVHIGLTALHTLFMREHNRIAAELAAQNPSWNDTTLFQEARRIVAAELQVITFTEWLPQILGNATINQYKLAEGNYRYDEELDATLANVFSTAAFRFGHSMVTTGQNVGGVNVSTGELFKRPQYVLNNLDGVIGGMINFPGERADAWYVNGMTREMFKKPGDPQSGDDIFSRNIQRGREHGLPAYNTWREYCDLDKVTDIRNATTNDFGSLQAKNLSDIYLHPDDMDLYSAGISEAPSTGAVVGPLYRCLIAKQFVNLRDGDRFWYETTTDSAVQFTTEQRTQLKRASLARIICDNGDSITEIRRKVFNYKQDPVPCSKVSKINLRRWKEE